MDTDQARKNRSNSERRWSRGSLIALVYALAFTSITLWMYINAWIAPSDGWAFKNSGSPADLNITMSRNIIGLQSELREGDKVLAIEGKSMRQIATETFAFKLQPPNWQDGQVIQYTVQRGDEVLNIAVPLQRLPLLQHVSSGFGVAVGGVVNPLAGILQNASSWLTFLLSVFVFWRRPRELAAQALLLIGVSFLFQMYYALYSLPLHLYPVTSIVAAGLVNGWTWLVIPSLVVLALAFPQPKFPLRQWPHGVVVGLYTLSIGLTLIPVVLFHNDLDLVDKIVTSLSNVYFLYLIIALVTVIHTLWKARGEVARAQAKWMVFGMTGFLILGTGGFALGNATGFNVLVSIIQNGGYLILPVCLAVAITRYHLFDIDVIIRRTLIYAVLTAILALFYFGSVVVLQQIFRGISGPEPDVAIILSTLTIAALFSPIRHRIQLIIDRRFYRSKYNAAKAQANFAIHARDEVDISRLVGAFIGVVEETLGPEHLSLWLKDTEKLTQVRGSDYDG